MSCFMEPTGELSSQCPAAGAATATVVMARDRRRSLSRFSHANHCHLDGDHHHHHHHNGHNLDPKMATNSTGQQQQPRLLGISQINVEQQQNSTERHDNSPDGHQNELIKQEEEEEGDQDDNSEVACKLISVKRPKTTTLLCRCNSILLPLFLIFLLPTSIKRNHQDDQNDDDELSWPSSLLATTETSTTTTKLLLDLIRLPLDRFQLETSGLISGAYGRDILMASSSGSGATGKHQSSDLQEEEQTHMMLLSPPAEHRSSSYGNAGHAYDSNQPTGGGHGEPIPVEYQAGGGSPDQQELQMPSPVVGTSSNEHHQHHQQHQAGALVDPQSARPPASSLQARSDLPAVRALNVKCEKNYMMVNIVFDKPFYGMVFSKGHYNNQKCVHLLPNSGNTSIEFEIHLGKCGMTSSDATGSGTNGNNQQTGLQAGQQQQQQPNGLYIENTIIIQYDPLVQEIYDQARKLRCTWYDYYEKSVSFRPYNVDMLDAVTANFLGDNIQCWMQIQVGKGPWASEVAGIVKIGQTMTMVLAIKDEENRFDMLVRNCVAHDGKHQPIQLVDEYGCVARPKIMAKFQKVRNFGTSATVVSYAHFQAFKFPDSMSVHFQCIIQVCRYDCPEPVCSGAQGAGPAELAGPNERPGLASGPSSSPPADYATSGTEMVASKEPVPGGNGYFASSMVPISSSNSSHTNNVHLKLDDSQGRIQVKLDTSMMAGLSRGASQQQQQQHQQHQASGPLPPHLLHMASSAAVSEPSGAKPAGGYPGMGSSFYVPTAGGAQLRQHSTQINGGQAAPSMPMMAAVSSSSSSSSRHPQQLLVAPHAGGQVHYSPPYNNGQSTRRTSSLFAHRLGDQLDELGGGGGGDGEHHQPAPYEAEHPLSLIGSPRGLRLGSPTVNSLLGADLHLRLRRSTSDRQQTEANATRKSRQLGPGSQQDDSTSVKTQRTIQVVSPDDVAFSLLEDDADDGPSITTKSNVSNSRRRQQQQAAPDQSVCFSTTRFIWGVLVTLGALASSVVIVTFVILRQRSQLEQKLSTVYDPTQTASAYNQSVGDQQAAATAAAQLLAAQRQREEIQQRNNYLARLYSQFAPATYWR